MSLTTPTTIRTLQSCAATRRRDSCRADIACGGPLLFVGLTVKPVGEPDAGERHVRFDERGWETEGCRMAEATAAILESTEGEASACPLACRLLGGLLQVEPIRR